MKEPSNSQIKAEMAQDPEQYQAFIRERERIKKEQRIAHPTYKESEIAREAYVQAYRIIKNKRPRQIQNSTDQLAKEVNAPAPKERKKGPDGSCHYIDPTVKINPDIWKDKPNPNFRDMVEWIYENMDVAFKPEDAPSAGTYSYMMRIRANKKLADEFYNKYFLALIPSKTQVDAWHERQGDDGQTQINALQRDLRRLKKDLATQTEDDVPLLHGTSSQEPSGKQILEDRSTEDGAGQPETT